MHTDFKYFLTFIICAVFAISVCCLLSSCATEKKFVAYHDKHPIVAAWHCATWYPIKDSITVKEVLKEGKTITIDGPTVYVNCDSFEMLKAELSKQGKPQPITSRVPCPPCPPSTSRVDTFDVSKEHYQESTAKVVFLQGSLDKVTKQKDSYIAKFNSVKKIALTEGGILAFLLIITILYLRFRGVKKELDTIKKVV